MRVETHWPMDYSLAPFSLGIIHITEPSLVMSYRPLPFSCDVIQITALLSWWYISETEQKRQTDRYLYMGIWASYSFLYISYFPFTPAQDTLIVQLPWLNWEDPLLFNKKVSDHLLVWVSFIVVCSDPFMMILTTFNFRG